jgi:hypothetical protein
MFGGGHWNGNENFQLGGKFEDTAEAQRNEKGGSVESRPVVG